MNSAVRIPESIISQVFAEYPGIRGPLALFSGGNDSLCSTHFAMEHGARGVVHINTGIGIRQTREFVRDTCKDNRWPLRELYPPALSYREMVVKYGFPGPGGHRFAYSWLKERAIRQIVRENKGHKLDRVGLITGVRTQESARRMGFVKPIVSVGAQVWIAPLFCFSTLDIADYMKANRLQENPVRRILGMSGECLCGAFAKPGELENKIRPNFPEVAGQIDAIAKEAKTAGKHCIWGTRPKKEKLLNQLEIPWMPLCSGCPTMRK
jgi:3'-phosphoadenosine 5'-phosphosulfate sulfotransferase (PAPS reductase)/FAD synthetase